MKQWYWVLVCLFAVHLAWAHNFENLETPPPVVDFTFTNDNTCSGTSIQFTSTVTGDAPYTYAWNFGDTTTSTVANPSHIFNSLGCATTTFTVTLTVTDVNLLTSVRTRTVTVKQKPDINFIDVNATGASNQFSNCLNASFSNPVYSITVDNISTSTCVATYTIDWGDGSGILTNPTFPIQHTYNILGAYSMVITGAGTNGCINTKTYVIKNVSNPSGGVNSPGSTQNLCTPTPLLQFTIANWGNNSPGTTYSVNYGDSSPIETFTQAQLNSSIYYNVANPSASQNYPIPHSYTATSCPQSEFTVTLVVTNACGSTTGTISNISTISKPIANFTAPSSACLTTNVLFTNTSIPGYDGGCDRSTKYIWDFGDPGSPGNIVNTGFTTAIPNGNHTFSTTGTFTVTLTAQNSCGTTTKVLQICIEAPLLPQFTLNPNNSCTPFAIIPTNTTNVTNQCSPTVYTWNVTYAAGNCGSSPPAPFYTNGTNQNSTTPNFNFTTPGTYSITLTADNSSCSPATSPAQIVTIKSPPTVSITPITAPCGTYIINPSIAIEQSCGGTITTRNWSFPGSDTPTSSNQNPGTITYPGPGTYTISLAVANECGNSTTATQTITLSTAPSLSNTSLTQAVCSGVSTTAVTLTGTPLATFPWTATAVGVTGFTPSGTGSIPVQTLFTTGATPGTVTYVIRPTIGSCVGAAVNYTITVSPAPLITTQPQSSTVCHGGTPTQLAVVVNTAVGSPQYQWYYNDTNTNVTTAASHLVTGATSSTYDPPSNIDGTRYYYCEISFSTGGCTMIASQTATVTIVPLPTITTQPIAAQSLCVGGQLASALTAAYTGGTGTVTYQWYLDNGVGFLPIPSANSASYLPPVFTTPGTYSYYVTISLGGNNCGSVTSNTTIITVYTDPILTVQPLASQTICQNATATTLTVTASGGSGTFTYQWFNGMVPIVGETNSSYTPPTATVGTQQYHCEVSQGTTLGCKVISDNASVTVNAAPTITLQPQPDTICQGGTAQTMTVSAINGIGTPNYEWFSNNTNSNTGGTSIQLGTSPSFTPPSANVGVVYYYCVVYFSGTGNCSQVPSQAASVTVSPGASINLQPTPLQEVCTGANLSPLTVGYTGGTGTANYQWFYNTSNSNTGGLLLQQGPSASYTPANISGPGIYYYYASISFTGNGCGAINSDVAAITVVPDPTVTAQPLASQSLCENVTAATLSVSAIGGSGAFTYQWYQNSTNNTATGTIVTGAISDTFIPDTTVVGTQYYYCVISQSGLGCQVTSAIAEVTVSPAPQFTLQPLPSTICLGQTTPPLTVAFSNGAGIPEYYWFYNTTASTVGAIATGTNNNTFNPPVTATGTLYYYCIIRLPSGGCTEIVSDIVAITVNQYPVIANATAVICSGTSFAVAPGSISGNTVPAGTTYTWPAPIVNPAGTITGFTAEATPQSTISQVLTNATVNPSTVTYTITPISGVCPGTPFTVTVTVNPSISPNVTVNNNACFGVNNASITTNITGGIPFNTGPPYQISWTGPNSFASSATSISNIEPGTYTLSIQDAGGCPILNTYTITQPDDIAIAVDLEKDITCFNDADGQINLSISGGTTPYSYTWTKDTLPFSATEDLSGLSPGTYVVSVTDANLCGPKTMTFTITQPLPLALSLISQTNVLCSGDATGAVTILASGGVPIQISPGVFDYTYSWTGPNGFVSSNQNLNAIVAGTYDLVITDANSCTQNLSVTVTQNPEIIITAATTPITCYGADNASITLTVTGGIPPYQANWSNLATGTFQDNLGAGTYTITVTDAINCQKAISVIIPQAPVFTVNPIVRNVSCFGAHDGSINLNLTGGIPTVALVWSDGSTAGTTRNNLGPGVYTASISDGTPCYLTRTFTILEPQPLVLTANKIDAFDCNDANSGSINLLVAGGSAPFTYLWSNGAVTEDLANIPAGNYQITVTDANGCIKTEQYVISRQPPIAIAVNTNTVFDCDTRYVEQTFVADVSGGVPPFQLLWSSGTVSGTNNEIMQTDTNGAVILSVTDSYGCTAAYPFDVNTPELGTVTFETSSYAYSTYGLYSVSDPIQFTGTVTGDYLSIAWNFGDGTVSTETNPIHTYVSPGDYVVTEVVTYPFGCVYTHQISLKVEKGYVLELPDAFTPDNNALNDTFRPVFKGLKTIRLDVYDTWGSLLFSEEGETLKGWDGKVKGVDVENGNYNCKVQATTFYNQIVNKARPFVLIK